jgi:hypothetical protein
MGTSIGNYGRKMYKNSTWLSKVAACHTLENVEINKICPKCTKEFTVIRKLNKNGTQRPNIKEKTYCSRSCANSHIQTQDTRKKISKKLNKKKEFQCNFCNKNFIAKRYSNRKFCCKKCFNKFRHNRLEEYKKYRSECCFKFQLKKYGNNFDFRPIKEYGWYRAKNRGNNLNGISRDHMISIKYGFEHGIPSEIISHPANCQLLRHNENISKGKKSSITLDELKKRIDSWGL